MCELPADSGGTLIDSLLVRLSALSS